MLKGSWFLKVSALFFALLTYFHVNKEILREESRTIDPSYKLIKLTTKTLPIIPRVGTTPADGYQVRLNEVAAKPAQIVVVGPEKLLEEASSADTAMIDISENTKTVVKKISLESIAGVNLSGEPYLIDVTIPIDKIGAVENKAK